MICLEVHLCFGMPCNNYHEKYLLITKFACGFILARNIQEGGDFGSRAAFHHPLHNVWD